MSNLFFYLPVFYLYRSRQKNIKKLVSWGAVYLFPACCLALIQSSFSLDELGIALLGIVMIYNFYEIGYIQNDTETVKKEKSPSLRLTPGQLSFYETHKAEIYTFRIVSGSILSLVVAQIIPCPGGFLICLFFLLLIYQIYNRIRNRWNLFLHIFLIGIRYCSIQLLFLPLMDWRIFACSFFAYPLPNILERASFPKYGIPFMKYLIRDKNRIPPFRVKYYAFTLSLLSILFWLTGWDCIRMIFLFAYYLIIRILFWIWHPKTNAMFIYFK